jgi:hypothetical protein
LSGDNLSRRLLESEAVKSLASELRIADQLRKLGWATSHGSFFVDPITDKLRETDVLAKRFWHRGHDLKTPKIHLDLIIEVKAIRGYHLVFAPSSFSPSYAPIEREWIGYAAERGVPRTRLVRALERADVGSSDIPLIMGRLFDMAYPEGFMVVGDFVIDPPPAPFAASAFRETNIGGQKDIGASVLWKAVQALNAFVRHATTSYLEGCCDSIELISDYARSRGLNLVDEVVDELADMVLRLRLFHPIVVIDAALWALDGECVERLPWCRFHQMNADGLVSTWCDIVQSESLDSYLETITVHYNEGMAEAGAKK